MRVVVRKFLPRGRGSNQKEETNDSIAGEKKKSGVQKKKKGSRLIKGICLKPGRLSEARKEPMEKRGRTGGV